MTTVSTDRFGRSAGGATAAIAGLLGVTSMVVGIVVSSTRDVFDNLQILGLALTLLGLVALLFIPIIREIVVVSIRHPLRVTRLQSRSLWDEIRGRP